MSKELTLYELVTESNKTKFDSLAIEDKVFFEGRYLNRNGEAESYFFAKEIKPGIILSSVFSVEAEFLAEKRGYGEISLYFDNPDDNPEEVRRKISEFDNRITILAPWISYDEGEKGKFSVFQLDSVLSGLIDKEITEILRELSRYGFRVE